MNGILKNFPVVFHQVFFLIAQLIILKFCGIKYSGSLAFIGAVSTFLAVLMNLRWDIEILVNRSREFHEYLLDASTSILFMLTLILVLNFLLGNPLQAHLIFSALAVAVHEVLVSILFAQNRIISYSFFRTIPAIALGCLALLDFRSEIIWALSYLLSSILLYIYLANLFKRALQNLSIARIKNIKFKGKISAAITATTFSFLSAFFIIIIKFNYGDEFVGLWSNTIRIFNFLISFLLAASLPFALKRLSKKSINRHKIKTFFYFWLSFLPLVIIFYLLITQYGIVIFSIFLPFNFDVTNTHLGYIFLIGVAISIVGSSQGLYQAMRQSNVLLLMIVATGFIGFIYTYDNTNLIFTRLIELFLFLISGLVGMILLHLVFKLFFCDNSNEEII